MKLNNNILQSSNEATENEACTLTTEGPKKKHSKKKRSKKKILLTILGIFVGLISIIVIVISVFASENVDAMNACIDAAMAELNEQYTVTPIDAGEYEEMTIYGIMNFHVEQYDIKELGNLSIMRVNMGFMQMATVVITPQDKNMPLLSMDYMYILGNRKCYVEYYDVVATKDEPYQKLLSSLSEVEKKYDYLEDIEASKAWYDHLLTVTYYKGGGSDYDEDFKNMMVDSLSTYLKHANDLPKLSDNERSEKLRITLEYTDGLIEKGGISTDFFKDSLGDEETKKFFDNVFFGTATE